MAHTTSPVPQLVHASYVPERGTPYHYHDGESLETISAKVGMRSWQELAQFNFKTTHPREVNWYLEKICGCRKQTHDGCNYMFSSADKRPFIYVPGRTTAAPGPKVQQPPVDLTVHFSSGLLQKLGGFKTRVEQLFKSYASSLAGYYKGFKERKLHFELKGGGLSVRVGGRYCGPAWGFTKQDVLSGKVKELPQPSDKIDAACMRHDQWYEDYGYFSRIADNGLMVSLAEVLYDPKSTDADRVDTVLMIAYFQLQSATVDPAYAQYTDFKKKFTSFFDQGWSVQSILNKMANNAGSVK